PRPRYLDPDCPLTLAEGLAEFAACNPGLIPPTDPELRELVLAHDSCHVLFGLTTSIEDEALADTWTLAGTTVTLGQYAAYLKRPEFLDLVKQIGLWNMVVGSLRALPRAVRAIRRARRMTRKWPFFDYARFLDVPVVELRRQFGVQLV
ncbi:MAG TPA: hypothetical protein VIK91_04275, partial [Nannocystis sp.]